MRQSKHRMAPIDLRIASGPTFDGTRVSIGVSARSRILDGAHLIRGEVGGSASYGFGATTAVRALDHSEGDSITYLDEATGVLHVSTEGILVLPEGNNPSPSASYAVIYAIAHAGTISVAASQSQVINHTYDSSATVVHRMESSSGSATLTIGNLVAGVPYTIAIHAHDEDTGYIETRLVNGTATDVVVDVVSASFLDATATFRVIDESVNVYAAIHEDSPEVAIAKLVDVGSAAYPGAIVAVGVDSYSGQVRRVDLLPGRTYHATVLAVKSTDSLARVWRSRALVTLAVPEIGVSVDRFTESTLSATVRTSGEAHDLFVHVTPFVVGGAAAYDAEAIVASGVSDDKTMIVPNVDSGEIPVVFRGLLENARYGVVVVAAQRSSGRVLNVTSVVAKTAALPDVLVAIQTVSYRGVGFRVTGFDLDGPFRVLTAVSSDSFTSQSAAAFASAGMTYTGNGIVDGTQTDFPNDIDATSVDFSYSHSNLDDDAHYVAVAVAVDEGSGTVQWAQQPFLTDFRPTAAIASLEPSGFAVSFDATVVSRDVAGLSVRYKVYDHLVGLDEEVIANDPSASHASAPGTGSRTLALRASGLLQATRYYLGVVAVAANGARSLAAIREFRTDSQPTASVAAEDVLARSLRATVRTYPNGAAVCDSAVALFPYGPVVDDALARAVLRGSAAGMIARSGFPGIHASGSNSAVFQGLTPGSRVTLVGATARADDDDGDVSFAWVDRYMRVEPVSGITGAPIVTTTAATATAFLAFNDPDADRENSADLFATVVPAGHADRSWMTAPAGANPVVPAAPVTSVRDVSSASMAYAASNLTPSTTYDLVVLARDTASGEEFSAAFPFTTRAVATISASVASVTPSSASLDVTASLPDGTFGLYVDVFQDAAGEGQVLDGWYDVAVGSGDRVAAGASFASERVVFGSLLSQRSYVAVAVAVDDATGERFAASAAFSTTSVPSSVNVVNGSAVCSSTSATFQLLVRDVDSVYTCYARAFPLAEADPVDDDILTSTVGSPSFARLFRSSVGQTPVSVTVTGLTAETQYRLVAVVVDGVTGSRAHDFEDFATLREEDVLDRVEYDNGYELTWRRSATYTAPLRGVQIGNGKIAYRTRMDDTVGASAVYLGGSFDFNSYGGYTNNLIEGFDASCLSLFDHSLGASPASFALAEQTLDMRAGLVRSSGRLVHAATSSAFGFRQDVMALRQMPYCLLTMYRITPENDIPEMRVFHEMEAGAGMDSAKYESVTVYHPSTGTSVPVFQGEAQVRNSSHAVSAATIYLIDRASLADTEHSGFNTFRNANRAFDSHVFRNLRAGVTYSWATLTAQATTSDFPRPAKELPRLLMQTVGSLSAGSDNHYDVAVRLRADHVSRWAASWRTSATLTPKIGLSAQDAKEFYRVKRALLFAQFQLFSCVRDHGTAELNPLHMTSLDADGNLFWNRELWIVPAMIYFQPKAVRAMLENRFDSLRAARTLAASQGHEGARFPYVGDAITYDAAPYWDVPSASYVFNTALVAVSAWDYFRASHDRDWLRSKGYPILSAIADYICSVSLQDPAAGSIRFPDVLDTNGERVSDPSFTLYACRSALRGAIESTHELRYPLPDKWASTYAKITIKFHDPVIIKHHATAALSDRMRLLEPLMALHPHYVNDFLRADVPRLVTSDHEAILRNAAHYGGAMSSGYEDNPFNTLMLMSAYAQVNRNSGTYSSTVKSLLLKAIADSERDVWGAVSASPASQHNDVSLSAMLVLSFVTSFAGMHVSGGVAQSGFYYVPFGVRSHATSYLPDTWQGVVVTGGDNRTINIINSALYR